MYAESKRSDVQLLLAAGVVQTRIAELTGVSVRTISRIGREASGAVDASKRARPGRPSTVEQYRDVVASMLRDEPNLKSVEVLRRLRERGYTGGKSAVYNLVKPLRAEGVHPIRRAGGEAGDFSQHGFGEVLVKWTGGGRERLTFFASRLKYSRYTVVTCVPNQQIETLVRTLTAHFSQIGGLPLVAVFDRPNAIVTKWDSNTGTVLAWNPIFADVKGRLGVTAEVSRPSHPRRNGSVDNLVGWVRNSFFRARQFVDADDLQTQLQAWHEEVNEQRPSRASGHIPGELLRAVEQGRLRPLKLGPEQLDLRFPVLVGPTGMVMYETNQYSMPAKAIGHSATLHLYPDRIVIEAGRYQAEHPRLSGRDQASILDDHRAGLLAAVNGKPGSKNPQSQEVEELGGDAQKVLPELAPGWVRDRERVEAR